MFTSTKFSGRVGKGLAVVALGAAAMVGSGCNNAAEGTLSGAALGAGAGAVIGSFFGSAGTGAAVGAVGGALGGGVIGDQNARGSGGRSYEVRTYSTRTDVYHHHHSHHSHHHHHHHHHGPRTWGHYRHYHW